MVDFTKYQEYGTNTSESIYIAALNNDCAYIIEYVKHNHDIHIKDQRQQTLLHLAVRNKAYEAIQLLLELEIDVNAKDKFGDTALHIATHMGSRQIINYLLHKKIDLNVQNQSKERPLHKACLKGNREIVALLLEEGADIHVFDEQRVSVIQKAIKSKSLKLVKQLVKAGALINTTDREGMTSLHYAAKYGTVDIVKYLLELGVNPYAKTEYALTPLHLAVEHPNYDMVHHFINSGCTSYDQSTFNESPYDIAQKKGNYEAIEIFNQLKNDHTYQDNLKACPLCLAVIKNEFDFAFSLSERVDVNQRDQFGNTPLFYAMMNKETMLVEKLIKHGARVDDIDHAHFDAVYYAVLIRDKDIFTQVLGHTKNLDKTYLGYSVNQFLSLTKAYDLLDILKKSDA
ncbi:MAG: ankyrin repeat domain-containing protein [Candidatus Izemoplasma sp.]|nr:ankyrin repeat domain-containing protein [Candidatus Izemoplasma sp.]